MQYYSSKTQQFQVSMKLELCMILRHCLHGKGSMWNRTRTVRIGLVFTREPMELFHTEPLVVPELVHLESRSRTEPNHKNSDANSQNRSRQVRLETWQGKIRLRTADDNCKICSQRNVLCKASKNKCMVGIFFKNFSCS